MHTFPRLKLTGIQGVSRSNDLRQTTAKPYWEYFVTLIPQSVCNHQVHLLYPPNTITFIPSPAFTQSYPPQESYEAPSPVTLDSFGPTIRVPLGYRILGRSGDKASNVNVGFFARTDDEYNWLCSFFTVQKMKELLGPIDYKGNKIDRFEMRKLRVVHFLLWDHLDRGYNACSKYDTLGKNDCEYLRAKTVDMPIVFVDRGRV